MKQPFEIANSLDAPKKNNFAKKLEQNANPFDLNFLNEHFGLDLSLVKKAEKLLSNYTIYFHDRKSAEEFTSLMDRYNTYPTFDWRNDSVYFKDFSAELILKGAFKPLKIARETPKMPSSLFFPMNTELTKLENGSIELAQSANFSELLQCSIKCFLLVKDTIQWVFRDEGKTGKHDQNAFYVEPTRNELILLDTLLRILDTNKVIYKLNLWFSILKNWEKFYQDFSVIDKDTLNNMVCFVYHFKDKKDIKDARNNLNVFYNHGFNENPYTLQDLLPMNGLSINGTM